jgi:hypothetical protein
VSPWPVVRTTLAIFTAAFVVLGVASGDLRWWAASAATGTAWWVWDLFVAHVLEPLEDWVVHVVSGGFLEGGRDTAGRPTLDETVAYLERHLANPTSRQVDLNAAIRLAEIYRTVKQDSARAEAVLRTVRERYPDAPELARFAPSEAD